MTRITGSGPREMRETAARMREADPLLRRELARRYNAAAPRLVAQVRASILSMRSHHDGTLRGQIAATVTSSVRSTRGGARLDIVELPDRMPAGKETLPRHTDSPRGWAHPVYPHGSRFKLAPSRARKYRGLPEAWRPQVKQGNWVWVRQIGKPRWFEQPVSRAHNQMQAAVQAAMDEVKHKTGG